MKTLKLLARGFVVFLVLFASMARSALAKLRFLPPDRNQAAGNSFLFRVALRDFQRGGNRNYLLQLSTQPPFVKRYRFPGQGVVVPIGYASSGVTATASGFDMTAVSIGQTHGGDAVSVSQGPVGFFVNCETCSTCATCATCATCSSCCSCNGCTSCGSCGTGNCTSCTSCGACGDCSSCGSCGSCVSCA